MLWDEFYYYYYYYYHYNVAQRPDKEMRLHRVFDSCKCKCKCKCVQLRELYYILLHRSVWQKILIFNAAKSRQLWSKKKHGTTPLTLTDADAEGDVFIELTREQSGRRAHTPSDNCSSHWRRSKLSNLKVVLKAHYEARSDALAFYVHILRRSVGTHVRRWDWLRVHPSGYAAWSCVG